MKGSARSRCLISLGAFLASLVVYGGTALWSGRTDSPAKAHYDRLAAAFLAGRLDLQDPPDTEDLTLHDGRWYVGFPPVPALLLLPWVAWRGVEGTSTVWLSVFLGAVNVALVHALLEALSARGISRLGARDNLWLTLMFGLGSVHWVMAPEGEVWFLAQVSAVTFMALGACATHWSLPPWVAGLALAAAMGGRLHAVLAWPLLLGIAAEDGRRAGLKRLASWAALSAVPVALALAGLLAYNQARFGSFLNFGYRAMNVDADFAREIEEHGLFSLRYAPRNLAVMLAGLPRIPEEGGLAPDPRGMSVFLTTPALAWAFRAGLRGPVLQCAWLALAALLLPILSYNSTGYWQFGYRFSLDLMVPWMVLVAAGAGERVSRLMKALILLGVGVNLWGVRWWY